MRTSGKSAATAFASRFVGNPWVITGGVSVGLSLLSVMQQYILASLNGRTARWQDVVFYGIDWLTLGLLTPLPFYLRKRWPLPAAYWRRSLAVHIAGFFTFAVCWAAIGLLLGSWLQRSLFTSGHTIVQLFVSWLSLTMPLSLIIYVATLHVANAFSYAREARDRASDAARLAAQLAESRLGALRMQLNPHFLFNSLNTVAVLIREQNSTAAGRVVDLLAGVLRQVLRSDRPHEVPLEEELYFLMQYLAIEQVRFSDRLNVRWVIAPEARSALVPDFLMQPLVENAVKHGIAKRAGGGSITIEAHVRG